MSDGCSVGRCVYYREEQIGFLQRRIAVMPKPVVRAEIDPAGGIGKGDLGGRKDHIQQIGLVRDRNYGRQPRIEPGYKNVTHLVEIKGLCQSRSMVNPG